LSASAASSSRIDLSWQDNSSNESGYTIQSATSSSGPWSQVTTVGPGVTSYSNTGLSAATTYYYRVCAYNSAGASALSGPASATPRAPPSSSSISQTPASASPAASSGTVTVSASSSSCAWSASSSATTWLTCPPSNVTGSGTVPWSATANSTTTPRTATI